MASCDDDFSLLGDDQSNPNQHHHHHQVLHHTPYAPRRFNPKPSNQIHLPHHQRNGDEDDENDVVVEASSAFHGVGVNPFAGDENSNPYDDNNAGVDEDEDLDANRSRIGGVRVEKRQSQEELSDGGTTNGGETTPYGSFKRPRTSSSSAGEYRKDREEWSDAAIACLLDTYSDKFTQLNRGNLRGRDWEEVASSVSERCEKLSKSVEQCKNKIDNLKKRYKLERHRMTSGGTSASHWPWFKKMEDIVGNSLATKGASDEDRSGSSMGNTVKPARRYPLVTYNPGVQINNVKSKATSNPRWRRVVLKISGAALACTGPNNIDPKVINLIAREVAMACRLGVEVAIVVGSRNFFCGSTWITATGLDRTTAYHISMMASVMNSALLQSSLEKIGVQARLQTAISVQGVGEPYNRQRATRHLDKGRVVIFGGIGATLGNPLLSSDASAALRAIDINAEAVVKGTNVDGVYDCHSQDSNVTFEHISFQDLASRGLTSMDTMALNFCEENSIPAVVVFNFLEAGNITKALCGEQVGTMIDRSGRGVS
ncbi:aspartate/glutamate/uridylate kinase family protein [Arabidopsis lyrata subsp. lyrata]|uniref:UMP kinase n=1 Tax=Arabidopsis lyrata subsp. lyrata TaxID=81972 RepID=D7L8U8_ARALL|nr:aspartate/glutamate/uridylate kinase family protein [Arabidopsis lyrata subsp. lyrata]